MKILVATTGKGLTEEIARELGFKVARISGRVRDRYCRMAMMEASSSALASTDHAQKWQVVSRLQHWVRQYMC